MKNPQRPSRRATASTASSRPRLPRTRIVEAESRRLIEESLSAWPVQRWEASDFGIDGVVEISDALTGSRDEEVSGRLFAIQLKATDIDEDKTSVTVSTGHLDYWRGHSLPVLLVKAHMPTRTMRARWIDDELFAELHARGVNLWEQGSAAVHLPVVLTAASKAEIERVVRRHQRNPPRLTPARFFELREKALMAASALAAIGARSGVESIGLVARQCRDVLQAAPYTVVVSGPQRVGKSTLINALLGVEVSPVAAFPTTAVPLVFRSGSTSSASVLFAGGTRKEIDPTAAGLRPYAAHQENQGNAKDVAAVEVTLPNDMLARGIALADAPGLRDSSKVVRDLTQRLLTSADAVLYVLDAGLGKKFHIDSGVVEDLRELRRSKDRLLVVLNQDDLLPEEHRGPLLAYVEKELRQHELWSALPVEPFFVSGQRGWEARAAGATTPASFARLEDELWGHLLRGRLTGLARLAAGSERLEEACADARALIGTRASDGIVATNLETSRRACTDGIEAARRGTSEWHEETRAAIDAFLYEREAARNTAFAAWLKAIDPKSPPPSKAEVEGVVQSHAMSDAQETWALLSQATSRLVETEGKRLAAVIAAARSELGTPTPVSMNVPGGALAPIDTSISESWLGMIVGGLFGVFFGLPGILVTGILGLLVGLGIGVERRRARMLSQYKNEYHTVLARVHEAIWSQIEERVAAAQQAVLDQVTGRLSTFADDLTRRLSRLGKPLTPVEARELESLATDVASLGLSVRSLRDEIAFLVNADADRGGPTTMPENAKAEEGASATRSA
jgi:ribosome biogenesis GTPase A